MKKAIGRPAKGSSWDLGALSSILSAQAKRQAKEDDEHMAALEKEIKNSRKTIRRLKASELMACLENMRHSHSHPRIHELRQTLYGLVRDEIERRLNEKG